MEIKCPETGLGIPNPQAGAAAEHKAGQLVSETTAQLNIFVKAAPSQHQSPAVLLCHVADRQSIPDGVLTIRIYRNDHGVRTKVTLYIGETGFDGLSFAGVSGEVQHRCTDLAGVKNIVAILSGASVVYNDDGETGIAKIADKVT